MSDSDPLENLLPSLVQCFGVIFIGYLSLRLKLITSQASAIGTYVTKFALPALFFRSMATMDLNDVNWFFILAVAISKLILFTITCVCTIIITRPVHFGKAGILSMFITQSNDVALGYPILLSLYPNLAKYIYLFAPAQLIIINPLCFILLECHEYRSAMARPDTINVSPKLRILLIFKSVILNPLIFMTVVGVIFNFILSHKLPLIVDKILKILADSFAGAALFYLGMNMVGKTSLLTKKGCYLLVFLLLGKLIFLPFLTREVVVHLLNRYSPSNDSMNYSLVAFLYAGLPTAPPVFLIANSFQILPDLIATGLVICTFVSGPLMFISARVITMVVDSKSQFDNVLKSTAVSISLLSLLSGVWVLLLFLLSKRFKSPIHKVTMCYTLYVILTCSGALIDRLCLSASSNYTTNQTASLGHYFRFSVFYVGCIGTRLCTVLIAAALMIIKRKSACHLMANLKYFYIIGFCAPVFITTLLVISSNKLTIVDIDPSFQYGHHQLITSLIIFITCIITTIVCVILEARFRHTANVQSNGSLKTTLDSDPLLIEYDSNYNIREDDNSLSRRTNHDISASNIEERHNSLMAGSETLKRDGDYQIQHHLILVLIIVVTMTFSMFLCLWRLINEAISGIYVELEFLDCVFNFGQGFILWMIFGLDTELIVIPFKKRIMAIFYHAEEFYLPPLGELSIDIIRIRKQFLKYHLENCRREIIRVIRYKLKLYVDVFFGKDLVDWIMTAGLANDRVDALGYGQVLLISGAIEHVNRNRNLLDDDESLYRFIEAMDNYDPSINIRESIDSVNILHNFDR